MTDHWFKIIISSIGAGSVLALSFFMFALKFEPQPLAAAVVHPRRYSPLTRVAGVKIQAVQMRQFVSSTPYETFIQKVNLYKAADTSTISIQFFGDVMLDRSVAKAMGSRGLDYLFDHSGPASAKRMFGETDLLIANLEGPFAPKRVPTSKSIAFRFDPGLAAQLKIYGFDAFSLANNHTLDMGHANVAYTQTLLKASGLGFFGHQTKESSSLIWIAEKGLSEKVAFVGFNVTDHIFNKTEAKKALDAAAKQSRYVFVFMHWGAEYKRISNDTQRNLAHWLVDNGATAVIGAHPHVVQEIEIYKGKQIYYSLGNFVFDQYFSKDTQEGFSVGMILKGGQVKEAFMFPFYSKKSQVYPMLPQERQTFLDWLNKNSRLGGKLIK